MPSNEERREVAARLREANEHGFYDDKTFVSKIELIIGTNPCGDYADLMTLYRLADLIEPEPERTCLVLCVKHGPVFDVLRFSCCGYEWAENRTDRGATEPDPNYCPNCGAKVVSK